MRQTCTAPVVGTATDGSLPSPSPQAVFSWIWWHEGLLKRRYTCISTRDQKAKILQYGRSPSFLSAQEITATGSLVLFICKNWRPFEMFGCDMKWSFLFLQRAGNQKKIHSFFPSQFPFSFLFLLGWTPCVGILINTRGGTHSSESSHMLPDFTSQSSATSRHNQVPLHAHLVDELYVLSTQRLLPLQCKWLISVIDTGFVLCEVRNGRVGSTPTVAPTLPCCPLNTKFCPNAQLLLSHQSAYRHVISLPWNFWQHSVFCFPLQ